MRSWTGRVFATVLGLLVLGLFQALSGLQGARYLVITADQFVPAAESLRAWKTKKGMFAKVVPVSQVGTNATQIQTYIRNAYNNWPVRPEYVLILGSPSLIPAYTGYYDTYYGDMSGDYRMEIPVGRLPAGTQRECSTLVNKTLAYERPSLQPDTTWFLKGTTVTREDQPPDPYYQEDARILRSYWQQSGYVLAESLSNFQGHSSPDVTAAANNGRAFITYRGVAGGMWWTPFREINPYNWTNGAMTPVVVGATCATVTLAPGETMYGDKFVRAVSPDALGGAIAYFGTTRSGDHISQFRSACYRGFFRALYEEGVFRLGLATLRGRFRVDSLYPNQERYMEWNLLGDPELNVWTGVPRRPEVEHESSIVMVPQNYRVTVRLNSLPLVGALVCIAKDSSLYHYAETDSSGQVNFAASPADTGLMSIVVTGRNLLPYEASCRILPAVRDVGCTGIEAPLGTIDSTTTITPSCSVYNYGNLAEGYRVRFKVGGLYNREVQVTDHRPGTSLRLLFPSCSVWTRGAHAVTCSTRLDADMQTANDRRTGSLTVNVLDVGCAAITAPAGLVDSGQTVVPCCSVSNWGTLPGTYSIRLRIGADYDESRTVSNHNPGISREVVFPVWTALHRGTHAVSCSTMQAGDLKPSNDSMIGSVTVGCHDVSCLAILSPQASLDSGTAVVPACSVYNHGNQTESYPLRMRIGSFYDTVATISNHAPGQGRYATFPAWTALQRGQHTAACSTMLSTDVRPANDRAATTTRVVVLDAGVLGIISPTGQIDSGRIIIPAVRVNNPGTEAVLIPVWLRIQTGPDQKEQGFKVIAHASRRFLGPSVPRTLSDQDYEDSVLVIIAAGDSETCQFRAWSALVPGQHELSAFTLLAGDMVRANDSSSGSVMVVQPVHDVSAAQVIAPAGLVEIGDSILPTAVVKNPGTATESFLVRFTIGAQYRDAQLAHVEPEAADTIRFKLWLARPLGNLTAACSTMLNADIDNSNDLASLPFQVLPGKGLEEAARDPMPALPDLVPNPFSDHVTVNCCLASRNWVELAIYSASGRLIRKTRTVSQGPGICQLTWNGCDESERQVGPGVYLLRLTTETSTITKRLLKAR